jgi:CheY-like chemotaxis protein
VSVEILLVDDDPLIRAVVAENIADNGIVVHVASGEAQALELVRQHPSISVALVDYCLPQPVGIALCRAIIAAAPWIRVALFTGHAQAAEIRREGTDLPVLPKVMRSERLRGAIEALAAGEPLPVDEAFAEGRIENLWRRERTRETVRAVGRALHNTYDSALQAPVPAPIRQTVRRLPEED